MSLGFDPFALFVAVLALWFAIRESRRNSSVVLRVRDCSFSYPQRLDENNAQHFGEFRVLIRNEGVALYAPQLRLSFLEITGYGIASMTVKRRGGSGDGEGSFQRGMIAEFSIKSYELDENDIRFLCRLENPAKQKAALCVYSQGYLARAIAVVTWAERIKSLWNKLAVKFNHRHYKKTGEGVEVFQVNPARFQLYTFPTLRFPLESFCDSLRKKATSSEQEA